MNSSYSNDRHTQDLLEPEEREREISLGTGTVLGIFFVLALICAAFFGFGYSMGKKSSPSAQTVAAPAETTAAADEDAAKPASGTPARPAAGHADDDAADTGSTAQDSDNSGSTTAAKNSNPAPVVVVAKPSAAALKPAVASAPAPVAAPAVRQVSLGRPTAPSPAPAAPAPVPVAGTGTMMVQVAAVSHQEDANLLVTELKKRGYTVAIRQLPQDKLLHLQLGPFATKKDADAMKQRLLADGYNAIVK